MINQHNTSVSSSCFVGILPLKDLVYVPLLFGEKCGGEGGVKSMGMKLFRSSSLMNETQEATHNTLLNNKKHTSKHTKSLS